MLSGVNWEIFLNFLAMESETRFLVHKAFYAVGVTTLRHSSSGLCGYKTSKHEDFELDNNYLVLPGLDIGKDLNYPFTLELCLCWGGMALE